MSASSSTDQSGTEPVAVPKGRSLAYLVSRYPTLSMIFVLREVVQLRELGFRITTASINPSDRPAESLTAEERNEAGQTYYVKKDGFVGAVKAYLGTFLTNFIGYFRGVGMVLQLAGFDLKRLFFNWMYFTEALMVGQWMRRQRQTHLHCHLGQQASTVGMYVSRIFGFGFSMTVHGPDEFYDAQGQYVAEKIAAADFIVCISSFARSQLMLLSDYSHWSKFVVSRLGVDPQIFSPISKADSEDGLEILCVGRLTPAKGQHLLMDAVDRLAVEGRQVRLRLVGGGPDEISLREHAARTRFPDRLVFEGAVNQDRIRTLYAAADIFCLPSFAEGVPVVLMEAMAMGIPCVSTNITGIPELIRHGIDGLLVVPSDLDALADALAHLMDDKALRQRFASSGRTRIQECYDLRRNVLDLAWHFAQRVKP